MLGPPPLPLLPGGGELFTVLNKKCPSAFSAPGLSINYSLCIIHYALFIMHYFTTFLPLTMNRPFWAFTTR